MRVNAAWDYAARTHINLTNLVFTTYHTFFELTIGSVWFLYKTSFFLHVIYQTLEPLLASLDQRVNHHRSDVAAARVIHTSVSFPLLPASNQRQVARCRAMSKIVLGVNIVIQTRNTILRENIEKVFYTEPKFR